MVLTRDVHFLEDPIEQENLRKTVDFSDDITFDENGQQIRNKILQIFM